MPDLYGVLVGDARVFPYLPRSKPIRANHCYFRRSYAKHDYINYNSRIVMVEVIEALNQTSPMRTFFYVIAFIACLSIVVNGFAVIIESIRRK